MTNRFYRALLAGAVSSLLVFGMASPAFAAVDLKDQWGLIPDDYVIVIPPSDNETIYVTPDTNVSNSSNKSTSPAIPQQEKIEIDLTALASSAVTLINNEREKAGLEPLLVDAILTKMAGVRADEANAYYNGNATYGAHYRPDGSLYSSIFDEYNTEFYNAGEVAGGNYRSAESIVKAWMESSGHRKHLLKEEATHFGVGVSISSDGKLSWIALFGK